MSISTGATAMGLNARLLDPGILAAARIRYRDTAGTGKFQ